MEYNCWSYKSILSYRILKRKDFDCLTLKLNLDVDVEIILKYRYCYEDQGIGEVLRGLFEIKYLLSLMTLFM